MKRIRNSMMFGMSILFSCLSLFGCGTESQSQKNWNYCNEIYMAFCNKNVETIESFFCETTKKTHDLEKEIQEAFEIIDGEIVSYNKFSISSGGEKVRDGEVVERHSSPDIEGIKTDTGKIYNIMINNREICSENPEYEGFSVITIFEVAPDDPSDWTNLYEIGEYIDYKISY